MAPEEEWRDIPGYERLYEVSNLGRVRSIRSGRVLKPSRMGKQEYRCLHLTNGGKQRCEKVHCLVAAAFIGPRPDYHDVHHKDNDPSHNVPDNLEYLHEVEHMWIHGVLGRKGERSYRARLKDEDVRRIRSLFSQGWGVCRIAREYPGFHHSAIGLITRGKRWGHLAS